MKTRIMAGNHPYNFYFTAQIGKDGDETYVGDGKMFPAHCPRATQLMELDVITVNWLYAMSQDPSQNAEMILNSVTAASANICSLVQAQASLLYTDKAQTIFKYRVSYEQASAACLQHDNDTYSFIA